MDKSDVTSKESVKKVKLPTKEDYESLPDFMAYEGGGSRFVRMCKDQPFLALGFFGGLAVFSHGVYNFRRRNRPISQYLLHYRVYTQGFVVGCFILCAASEAYKAYKSSKEDTKKEKLNEHLKV